jgi:hypothetical protein
MSLDDACQSLHEQNLFDDRLQVNIETAIKDSTNDKAPLRKEEQAAIYLYTMKWDNEPQSSFHAVLNRTLREGNSKALEPWSNYLQLFTSALSKIP